MSWKDFPTILNSLVKSVCDEVNECSPNPCLNGGSCQSSAHTFQCTCPVGFSGAKCERRCPIQLDIAFVLDLSGSLEEVYDVVIQFAKQAIYGLPIGMTRVSVVTYAGMPQIMFDLNTYTTPATIRNALAFSKAGGTTNTQEAIKLATQSVFTAARGDRAGVKNVMVVVTDGQSNVQQANTLPEAAKARQQGIELYSVGIGMDVNVAEIDGMASDARQSHQVYVRSPSEVEAGAKKLLDLLCQQ
jgi:collagen type VI alpha